MLRKKPAKKRTAKPATKTRKRTVKTKKNTKAKAAKKIKVAGLSAMEQGIMSVARSYGTSASMKRRLGTLRAQVKTGLISVGERQGILNGLSGKKKYGE